MVTFGHIFGYSLFQHLVTLNSFFQQSCQALELGGVSGTAFKAPTLGSKPVENDVTEYYNGGCNLTVIIQRSIFWESERLMQCYQ